MRVLRCGGKKEGARKEERSAIVFVFDATSCVIAAQLLQGRPLLLLLF